MRYFSVSGVLCPVKYTSVFCPIEWCKTGISTHKRVYELLDLSFSFLNSDKTIL